MNPNNKNYKLHAQTISDNTCETLIFENLENKWLTTIEAAEYLRVSPKCLLNMTSNGQTTFYKLGRRNRYLESDLRKLLQAKPKGDFHGN